MKNIFSLFILMLFAEQFCFATIRNSSDTITVVKRECKASVVDGNNSSTFSLTYFEFDSLPIPLRDSVKKIFEKFVKEGFYSEDTTFDIKQIATQFIFPLPKNVVDGNDDHSYTGTFSIISETKHTLSLASSYSTEGPWQWFGNHGGQHASDYFVLNKSTGKKLTFGDFIQSTKLSEFKKIDFKYLENNMAGNESSNEPGNEQNHKFGEQLYYSLYSTFYIDKNGLHRFFAGWDYGQFYSTEYLIPIKELKPLLRKDFEW
ncbi:MAG: hypothetical protein RI955_341 [Bacteroidota bacterium]|jgi:hypothetical protein